MKSLSFAVAFALMTLPARPLILSAQEPAKPALSEWKNIKNIPPGDELSVVLRNRESVKGRLNSVSDTTLTLSRGKSQIDVNRADAFRIYRIIPRSAKSATLIGTGIGAGIGASIGAGIVGTDTDEGWPIVLLGGLGAGLGAITGFLIGSRRLQILVFENP